MRTAGTMGGCAGVKSASMLACVLLVGVRVEEAATHGRGTLLLVRHRVVSSNYRVGLPISRKVLQSMFWEVPMADWLICSYLLPRQALATHVEKHNKTLRLIDSPALYSVCT